MQSNRPSTIIRLQLCVSLCLLTATNWKLMTSDCELQCESLLTWQHITSRIFKPLNSNYTIKILVYWNMIVVTLVSEKGRAGTRVVQQKCIVSTNHNNATAICGKIVRLLWTGGKAHSLCPATHSYNRQSQASVSSSMWKRADNSFLRVC